MRDFNFDKLNRPATLEEYKDGNKTPPCSSHDKETELTEASSRIDKIKSRIFESGAQRDSNENKSAIHNLKGYTRLRFGYHMRIGANKYGDSNWEKGLPTECYLESLDRHLAMYMMGDRSEDHLSAIIFGIRGCMINEQKDGIQPNYYFNKLKHEVNKETKKDI